MFAEVLISEVLLFTPALPLNAQFASAFQGYSLAEVKCRKLPSPLMMLSNLSRSVTFRIPVPPP